MSKIIGLDLGTNSIGWALRNSHLTGNQIEKFGVITFATGVGKDDYGRYTKSYASERTQKRSTRRLYQSRKYRLWATLEHLITEGYCPLTIEDLNKWRHYNKEEAIKNNNGGRVYPVNNVAFDAWIKLDFNYDGKPDYSSPYQLRKELAEVKMDFTKEENRFKLGRALYHIAQRRGFKSSRKSVDDTKEKEVEIENNEFELQVSEKKKSKKLQELFPDFDTSIPIGVFLANKENEGKRIRLDITQYLVRENYKDEIKFIFEFQSLDFAHSLYIKLIESGKNRNDGSIFYKRPLRSQKGLIGLCTFEQETRIDKKTGKQYQTGKYRAPISHPSFETFRAWAFLNNIQYKPFMPNVSYKENPNEAKKLELSLLQEIFNKLFFRKKAYFPFSDITDFLKSKGKNWELNYKPKTTVTACTVSAHLKDIFGNDYLQIKISKEKSPKIEKDYYDIDDIWHVLFSFEDQELVAEFAEQKLQLSQEKVKKFLIAWNALPVGYGMLSINAINKINKFLQKGLIYTEAVLLANIPTIIGEDVYQYKEEVLLVSISSVIKENRHQKSVLTIVNSLISKHKNLEASEGLGRKDNSYKLDDSDVKDIYVTIEEQFGINKWKEFSEDEKQEIFTIAKDCYQAYFFTQGLVRNNGNDERIVTIESNGKKYYKTESGFYSLPKLIDTLGEFLQLHFNVSDESLKKLYHPSEINIYPPAKEDANGILKLGSPKTGSFKNPMAMRTLHELRKLMNYMIETNQIDSDTRIVVEVARELNDSNKRWAIETWQRQREVENQEFAQAIDQLLKDDKSIIANPKSGDDIDKVRLFYEQNDEQTLPAVAEDQEKGKKKKESSKDEAVRWNGYGKKLIDKYRLWKEQGYQCMYTGKLIRITDLFRENLIDIEHTIPRSKSFDNSLANLTVCYADYNRTIKKNQIPAQLANYDDILPRLEKWKEKVERIKQQIDFWKTKSKKAADKQLKDDAIKQRHLWQMELDYWQNKLDRFTIKEITSGFKNSQKVDTQLISKYAFHYLKTYFEKVDVQKGSITAEFRKIYMLQPSDEKKDRSKHSHHAKDAAVLTLIPVAAKRDAILEAYYESKENKTKFSDSVPYKGFKREFIWEIDDKVLINNITNNQELTPSKRKIRKRGKEQFIPGTNKVKWATGDSIRGQLHQETFYGAIRPAQKGEKGNLLKDEEGKFIQEEKVKYVIRVPFLYKKDNNSPGFKSLEEIEKQIVDEGLKNHIRKQVQEAGGLKEAFDKGIYLLDDKGNPHGNKIRHIRVWASVSEPLAIKKQTNLSKSEYKQHYWAANATNSYFALYKGDGKFGFQYKSLFETSQFKSTIGAKKKEDLFAPLLRVNKGSKEYELRLSFILEYGTKVLFMDKEERKEDLREIQNSELLKRLYEYTSYEDNNGSANLKFKYHLEAREKQKISESYKESEIDLLNPKPTLRLAYSKYPFLVEGYDFIVEMDGTIKWK